MKTEPSDEGASSARTVHFVSLGCAKNQVDTEVMLGVSAAEQYRWVPNPEEADVIVVNTCGFIGPAKQESIDAIVEMAEHRSEGRCEKLVVAGCLSQRYSDDLAKELPEVDHFIGSSDMLKLGPILKSPTPRLNVGNPAHYTMSASDPRLRAGNNFSAYLKLAEGCNRTCSFCAIPSMRGKQRSRSVEDLVQEAKRLVAEGVLELNLISQDTIAYGRDLPGEKRTDLAELLRALGEVQGLRWIRVHYLYPEKLQPQLVALFRDHPKVLPYIDMPLQHVADGVLRSMRRGHGGDRIYRTVEHLREQLEEMIFRTTLIVGHPGESEQDFQELLKFTQWAQFDHLGVFQYSPEEGTRSMDLLAQNVAPAVPQEVIEQRQQELMELQRDISAASMGSRVGQTLEVLVEGTSEESDLLLDGRWWGQAQDVDGKVILTNGMPDLGSFQRATVTHATDYDLIADLERTESGERAANRISLPTIP